MLPALRSLSALLILGWWLTGFRGALGQRALGQVAEVALNLIRRGERPIFASLKVETLLRQLWRLLALLRRLLTRRRAPRASQDPNLATWEDTCKIRSRAVRLVSAFP